MWWMHGGDSATVVGNGGAEMQLVTVDSWRGAHHTIRVRKERTSATASTDMSAPAALRRALSGSFGSERGAASDQEVDEDEETVHIFSLASGQLYERLLKVMVMGVKAHTTAPLKFWFLSNFASPQFKVCDFVPRLCDFMSTLCVLK